MGKASRDKGNRREREMVGRFNSLPGLYANRVPLSGASQGYKGDIHLWPLEDGQAQLDQMLQVEVKARSSASGWLTIKKWLGDNDLLVLIEDRAEPLVVLPWGVFQSLVSVSRGGDENGTIGTTVEDSGRGTGPGQALLGAAAGGVTC